MRRKRRIDRKLHATFVRDVGDAVVSSDNWLHRLATAEVGDELEITPSSLSRDHEGASAARRWSLSFKAVRVSPQDLFSTDREISPEGVCFKLFATRYHDIVHGWFIPEDEL